ncbi:hypothetical protein Bbelb_152310 [Branchiostoma belcheri]|nr:hypothetical protein Bbelb_152310 [Branchiostoma belcheri]
MPGLIYGLSREVTISVLPRLNMEELIYELNRRVKNLDRENSIKDRLVCILRDVMLEEYRQSERRSISDVDFSNPVIVPREKRTKRIMRENAPTAYAETMSSSPGPSRQRSGLDVVMNPESNDTTRSENRMNAKEPELNTDQAQLQQEQLCDVPSPSSSTLPSDDTPPTQVNTTADSPIVIKEEPFDMTTEDGETRACDDEGNIDSPTLGTHVFNIMNPMSSSSYSKNPLGGNKSREKISAASHQPTPDHSDVRQWECHVSEDDRIRQIYQPSNPDNAVSFPDDRDTGFVDTGHEQSNAQHDQPGDFPAYDNRPSLVPNDNTSNSMQNNFKPYKCNQCGFRSMYPHNLKKHMKHHTAGKRFMCNECGYRAYDKYRLVEHTRTHTGEKPYSCDMCDYKAAFKSQIMKHMKKNHMTVKPYSCGICDHKTYQASDMKLHMKCHALG